ncbi:hypothetical protein C8Q77DRAFT_116753 [Trametes polyzona]|nr:hypothetical protein C8Q77DRAFT_116753 [Trametes polyzona]
MVARIWKATFLLVISLSGASSSDSTVDDSDSRITYSPSTQWSQGASCNGCLIHPDASLTEQGTWHDTTYTPQQTLPSISFSFTGVAVSVFNILPGPVPGAITTHVDLTFELDGVLGQPFTYDPSADSPFRSLSDHGLTWPQSFSLTTSCSLSRILRLPPRSCLHLPS